MVFSLLLLMMCCGLGHGVNNQPVIGIFMQNASNKRYGDTFLSANYVKFIEQAGARVVPIKVREPLSYYQNLFSQINGLLYPGGHTGTVNSDYAKAGKIMYNMVEKANVNGDFFPLFGICEGHQLLSYLSTNHRLIHNSPAYGVSLPLVFEPDFRQSRLMKDMSQTMVDDLKNQSITPNFHHYGISVSTYQQSTSMKAFYRLISTNTDDNGQHFISTMEAYKYPFYTLQWHVEKLAFDWTPNSPVVHSSDTVLVSQYFANFFVNEARKSKHQFHSDKELEDNLIEKFHMEYWASSFHQNYYINYTNSAAHAILG